MPYERTFQAASVGAKTRSAGACLARGKLGDGRAFLCICGLLKSSPFCHKKCAVRAFPPKGYLRPIVEIFNNKGGAAPS